MFSKISNFRNRFQKQKHNSSSQIGSDSRGEEDRLDLSFFSSKSPLSGQFADGISPVASEASSRDSSLQSSATFPTYGDAYRSSSGQADEIDAGNHELVPYQDAEEQFLEEHEGYFAHLWIDKVRKDQYPKLDLQRIVYLDYATAPLYSRYQVEKHMEFLLQEAKPWAGQIYTTNNSSSQDMDYINITSNRLLELFNTTEKDYTIIFTPDVASTYCLFSEMHPFHKGTVLLINEDNHEYIYHISRAAQRSGSKILSSPIRERDFCIQDSEMHRLLVRRGWSGFGRGLLVYPAQSHFSGVRHSLNWIIEAQQNGWKVCLDVSNCVPTIEIDLALYQPEFVVGSLFHILGYPSGVGFLLVKRSSHSVCRERKTNQLIIAEVPEQGRAVRTVGAGEGLSTQTFAALSFGLEHLETLGTVYIQTRVDSLVSWSFDTLKSLRHKLEQKPLLKKLNTEDRSWHSMF
ncbi:molybdenum cofactor sulfurase-like isoform X2 [Aristolochia californica]|uniref:molybdenum cofactor sulfurase-like isoform X2 n=1 Tax=Aristolochia californica TaxID=171875 RepID=UPI0035DC0A44